MPKKYEKVTNNIGRCLECGESCNNRYIGNHIKLSHNMTSKEYFDKFHKQDGDGICIECDKETKFLKLSKGYRKTCGKKCGSKMTRRLFFEEHGYYNDFSFSGNVAMCKATMIERYGTDSLSSLEFVKEKRKKTNVERFGVECNFNIPFFQKDSCFKKYGVESVANIPGVKESRIKTNLKRYGSEHPMQNEEVADDVLMAVEQGQILKNIEQYLETHYWHKVHLNLALSGFVKKIISEYREAQSLDMISKQKVINIL